MKDFKLPDLGEGVHEGQIIRVMVKPGDIVREDQPLLEVETDKAAVVIPCPFSGVVQKVYVREKQMVHVGDVMVSISDAKADDATGQATSVAGANAHSDATSQGITGAKERREPVRTSTAAVLRAKPQAAASIDAASAMRHKPASPAVRKLARSMGIDIETINGSGPGGRVQRGDLELVNARSSSVRDAPERLVRTHGAHAPNRAVAARIHHDPLPESASIAFPQGEDASDAYGEITRVPISQARKTIANIMTQSWTTIPHATDFDDADVTELEQLRKGYTSPDHPDRKITLLAFVIRAVVRALQRFPDFNAHFDAERGEAVYKRYINIAVGVHTERGLVPMVLRDADHLTIPQISDALNVIGEKARAASFSVNDTRGGTYTISNAGAMGGSRYSTPIITPPQAAVLAIGRTRWMPWVMESDSSSSSQRGIAPRLIMPLSHSIDHRLLDGGQEVQFMKHIIGDLQNPARLLL